MAESNIWHLPGSVTARRKSQPSRRSEGLISATGRKIMRTKLLSGAIIAISINCLALSGRPTVWAEPSSPCKTQTAAENTMVMQSPCSPTHVKANQTLNPSLLNVAITDAHATVHPKIIPVQIQAVGLVSRPAITICGSTMWNIMRLKSLVLHSGWLHVLPR